MNTSLDRQTHLLARLANQPHRVAALRKGKQPGNSLTDDDYFEAEELVVDPEEHGENQEKSNAPAQLSVGKRTTVQASPETALAADGSNYLSKKHGDAASSLRQLLEKEEKPKADRRGMIIDLLV